MKSTLRSPRFRLLMLILAVLTAAAAPAGAAGSRPPAETSSQAVVQMSQEELQEAVISYANRFIATIGQAAFDLEAAAPTKEGRLIAAARKVYSLSAVAEIAAGPRPGPALLDLVVITTLNRLVWDQYWRPQVFGMPASIMVDAFKNMEADAWALAAKVMTPEQMDELRDLILDWYDDHPNQRAVDYIRFSDFGDLGRKPNLKEIQKPGGLLAPIREATAAVDEVRMTSERAMFLLTKMQLIMGFQAELVYKQIVMQPEMDTLLKDVSGFRSTADRFADMVEELPKQVADERSAAISDAGKLIARERTAILKAIDQKETAIHRINQDVQGTLASADKSLATLQQISADAERMIQTSQQTLIIMRELVGDVERLATRFEPKDRSAPTKPFDIDAYIAAIEKVQGALESLNQMVLNVERNSSPLVANLLEQFNRAADQRVDHIFHRLFQLLATTGVLVVIILVAIRLTRTRRRSA